MDELTVKYETLKFVLARYESLIVAFSGGVDSALVLKVAYEVLGPKVLAVTADSPSVPRREIAEAQRLAKSIGARHLVMATEEIRNANYVANPANRCYFCKSELYSKLAEIARREEIRYVANGTNVDDLGDYRPGLQAAAEYQVASPLREAGLTKADVRTLAKRLHLEIWDKPASPCLSSRIPYGMEVTPQKLTAIEAAESSLRDLGLVELRVRHFGKKARIETHKRDFGVVEQNYDQIIPKFKALGFEEIELAEFKSGALNVALKPTLSEF
ncbi:ATP-dependent sacrificial sulfur transferase LarE [candidate division KSB1 bacterium]|nr:ATP-dependent sacrificial sulfur transferase LarE [candidate division KSB1 bacterium]